MQWKWRGVRQKKGMTVAVGEEWKERGDAKATAAAAAAMYDRKGKAVAGAMPCHTERERERDSRGGVIL